MFDHALSRFEPEPVIGSNPQRAPTVLIVDDEEPIRRFVDRVLRSAGYATAVATGGADAIQVAAHLPSLDVLLTDMTMPEISGDEVARRLRQIRPELKVLYYTGYSDRLFDEKGRMWEDEAFLDKPCGARGLLEAVALLCHGNRWIGEGPLGQASVPAAQGMRSE